MLFPLVMLFVLYWKMNTLSTLFTNFEIHLFTEELSGIFVKSISTGSAADLCKKIQVNDRIVEVYIIYIIIVSKIIFI